MPNVYKRADSPYLWCWGYYPDGRIWKASTKQSAPRAAEKAARVIERQRLERVDAGVELEPIALSAALDALAEHKRRKRVRPGTLEKLASKRLVLERIFGARANVHALTLEDLERYVDVRRRETVRRVDVVAIGPAHVREEPIKDHTIAMELGQLIAALRRLKKHDLYDGDPAALWPEALDEAIYKPRDRWLRVEEYSALLPQLTEHRRRYVTLYVTTGVRFSELYQCERAGDVLRVTQTKGNAKVGEVKTRDVPLSVDARAVLDAHPLPWPVWQKGRMGDDLKRACARAGIARVSANDLRRTFVSWLANAGVPELTVVRLVGHASSTMVRRVYAQLAPATLAEAIGRLPDLGEARPKLVHSLYAASGDRP